MLSTAVVTVASATALPTTHSVTGSAGTVHSLSNGTIGVPNNSGFSDSDAAASSPREFSSDQTASDEGSADEASYERSEDPATRQADGVVALGQFQPLKGPTNKTEEVLPLVPNNQQPVTTKPTADQWNLMKVRVGFDVTRKGERSLVIDGYKFTKSRDGMSDRVFWRCSRRECKATAVTVSDRVEHVRTLHTHKPPLAGEFFVESAGGAKLQTVRFNYAPSSTKPRARRRVNSQQPLAQDPTQPTTVNREEADSTGVNGDTTVTSPIALANMTTTATTTAITSVPTGCVSNAGSLDQERYRSADGDGDSTNIQARAVAAILSSLMERRAASYRKGTIGATSCHLPQTLEATEYLDSPSAGRSKLGARQYAVSSLSCLLGMNDRCETVSSHLSPQNQSPPLYVQASRDMTIPHSDNHHHLLGQCDSVSTQQQQQAKRDSQNSTPDPPFEVSMNSPPPPPPLPPPTGYPGLIPISPPISTESPERPPLSYHGLFSRGTTVTASSTTGLSSAKLTDLASLASSIRPVLTSSECPSSETDLTYERSHVHNTNLPVSTANQATAVHLGSTVGLLGKAVLGQLVFLSGDQLKELSTASSTGPQYRVRRSSNSSFLLSPPDDPFSNNPPLFTDTRPNSSISGPSEQLPQPFTSSPRSNPTGLPHKELRNGQMETERRLHSLVVALLLPPVVTFALTRARAVMIIHLFARLPPPARFPYSLSVWRTARTRRSSLGSSARMCLVISVRTFSRARRVCVSDAYRFVVTTAPTTAATSSDPLLQSTHTVADCAAPHVPAGFSGLRSEVSQTPNFSSVGPVLHWKKEKMRESEEAAAADELEHGRRRHFTAFSQQQAPPVVALRRKRCASDCHPPQSRGVAFAGLHDVQTASSRSISGSETATTRPDRYQGHFSSDSAVPVGDWCTQVQDDVLAKILNTVQQLTARLDGDSDPPEVIQNCKAIQACLDTIHALKRARYEPPGACVRPLVPSFPSAPLDAEHSSAAGHSGPSDMLKGLLDPCNEGLP
ncbi:hypothetical protein AAHC03_026157 [Spirometra sp. Aus1]